MGALESVEGVKIVPGSPLELHAELYNIALARTATRKAGRPGMPIYGSSFPSLATDMSATSPEYGYKRSDLRCLWTLPHMKVDYQTLSRAAHFAEYGCYTSSAGQTFLGGISGGPETSAVTSVAECIGAIVLFQTLINAAVVISTRYQPYNWIIDRPGMWGSVLATSAINKNTHTINTLGALTLAGPCTEMCLLELAVQSVAGITMGLHPYGNGCNTGLVLDHCTGMESRFQGEVARAAAGIKRENANDIVKVLMSRYEPLLNENKIPYGKSFRECYDMNTISPTAEYQGIYKKVREELEDLGLNFDRV
jgi:methylamine--corrinoid protein Co-methyltransferase